MHRGWRTRAPNETNKTTEGFHPRRVRRAPLEPRRTMAGHPQIQRSRGSRAPGRTVDTQRGLPVTMEPLELQVGNPWGRLGALRRPKRDTGGSLSHRRALGGGCQNRARVCLLKAGHAQRLGARALREMLGAGRPDHVSEGLHSEFQHVWSSGLHTYVGFGRRQSNNAKKHVYAVGRRVRPSSPAVAHLGMRIGILV